MIPLDNLLVWLLASLSPTIFDCRQDLHIEVAFGHGRSMGVESIFQSDELWHVETGHGIRFSMPLSTPLEIDFYQQIVARESALNKRQFGAGSLLIVPGQFRELIDDVAEASGVPADLLAAVVVAESSFRPHAISPKGAAGLMQILPETGSEWGCENLFDPSGNLISGAFYLAWLGKRFDFDWRKAVMAYHAGIGNMAKYENQVPFQETLKYVEHVFTLWQNSKQ